MDNLTHSATGLFLARTGLGRDVPHAAWILVLAANIPDLDVASAAGGPLVYLHYHRHLTHAIPLLPFMALLPVLLVRLAARKRLPWMRAYAISLVGAASHLALDLTNIYGIRLLLPFRPDWFRLDLTSVIDLWIWGAFLIALCGPVLARLVNSEIGVRRARPGRGFAILALLFLLAYTGTRAVLHSRATAVLDSRMYDGAAPLRVAALPSPINPWRWRGLVETREFYVAEDVNLLGEFDPSEGRRWYKPEESPARQAAARTPVFQEFLRFSQFPLWRVAPVWEPPDAVRVEAMDLRFGTPLSPGFVATAVVDSGGRALSAGFTFGSAGPK